jgi:ankyrin repeat protein
LGWAARNGLKDMVEWLLENGSKTNLPDDEDWATPLAWARKRGHVEVENLLLTHGATA